MALLLDTHVWIWSQVEPSRLNATAQDMLVDPSESLYLSTISTLETARLTTAGHITLSCTLEEWVSASVDALCCATLEISHAIAIGAYRLPGDFHRDPADRLIVATAREHDLTVLTADQRILKYAHVKSISAK